MILSFLVILIIAAAFLAFYTFLNSTSLILKIVLSLLFLNFMLGHVILLTYRLLFRPELKLLLADTRLLNSEINFKYLVLLNILQLISVCIGILLFSNSRIAKNRENHSERDKYFPKQLTNALILTTLIGWIGNIAVILGDGNYFSAFHPFELFGTLWLVSGFRLTPFQNWIAYFFASIHLIWAVFLFHSKSEAFLIVIAIMIRVSHSRRQINFRKILAISILALLLWPIIQVQKGILTLSKVQSQLVSQGENYAYVKSFLIGFIERFDGTDSITDAYLAGSGSWYDFFDYVNLIFVKLIPNISFLLGDYFGEYTETSKSLGQLWNDQMRPITISNVTGGVPVSYGPLAEGYAITGLMLGIILCIVFGAFLAYFCNACYSEKLFTTSCGLYFVCRLENLQNGVASLILMFPKMLQCYVLIKVFMVIQNTSAQRSMKKTES